jgi:hypothetical protein
MGQCFASYTLNPPGPLSVGATTTLDLVAASDEHTEPGAVLIELEDAPHVAVTVTQQWRFSANGGETWTPDLDALRASLPDDAVIEESIDYDATTSAPELQIEETQLGEFRITRVG